MEHPGKTGSSDAASELERPSVRQGSISFPSKVVSRIVEKEIIGVVKSLCQGSPREQYKAVQEHFVPEASFVHPFCRVPSFSDVTVPGLGTVNSRTLVLAIFKWYKILSPKIAIEIESAVLDKQTNRLYLQISQTFAIWFIPFYSAPVHLTTVLDLVQCRVTSDGKILDRRAVAQKDVEGPTYAEVAATSPDDDGKGKAHHSPAEATATPPGRTRYMISRQEDLYQVNEFLKFILPGIGAPAWAVWQATSTLICAFAVLACWPILMLLGLTGLESAQAEKGKKA